MSQHVITIAHLYPRDMSIYGDMGNIITLKRRLEWRGYDVKVDPVEVDEPYDFSGADIVFGGGGQDSGQLIVGPDLQKRGEALRAAAADGMPMLVICGLYQLFGRSFITLDQREIPGIAIFKASTLGSTKRMIGNVTVESKKFGRLVGFENHSGQTILEPSELPLGNVTKGFGNDARSKREGALTHNVIGTYMHGPILPKNPSLADYLIAQAVMRRYQIAVLSPLDDTMEAAAARSAAKRPR